MEGRSSPQARASTVIICPVRMTITWSKNLATCMIAFAPQYHPVRHYLPFTHGKTEFQGIWLAQGPWPGKAVRGGGWFSAQLSLWRLFGSSVADGDSGTKLG